MNTPMNPIVTPPGFDPSSGECDTDLFRLMFPEFADETKYPDAMIQVYWDIAHTFISPVDCPCQLLNGKALGYAGYLMTAHLMWLATQSSSPSGGSGGSSSAGGTAGGIVTSASIGEVSVSMAQPPFKSGWDYWLNQSPYGQQLLALLRIVSVGGTFVGGLPERTGFRKVGGVFW